jgi:hypothetical protein
MAKSYRSRVDRRVHYKRKNAYHNTLQFIKNIAIYYSIPVSRLYSPFSPTISNDDNKIRLADSILAMSMTDHNSAEIEVTLQKFRTNVADTPSIRMKDSCAGVTDETS